MIIINTSHILPDTPYLLDGTESAEILELPPDADPPLAPAGDITYHLSAVMAGTDLIVTGRASVPLATVCARCLDDITVTIAGKGLGFHFEKVRDLEVDLTDDVREELLLAFPSCFYCSPDCKGICPMCGANLNHASCACDTREAEPEPDAAAPSPWDQSLRRQNRPRKQSTRRPRRKRPRQRKPLRKNPRKIDRNRSSGRGEMYLNHGPDRPKTQSCIRQI